jgi:uncharacterized protein
MKKPFSLWQYLLIVIALSWPFQFWYIFKAETTFDKYLFSSLSMVMVTVATLIARQYVFKEGFNKARLNFGKPIHYVFVMVFALFLWFVPSVIESSLDMNKTIGLIAIANMILMFSMRFVGTLIPAFGEEFGWRGYMLPRLVEKMGAMKGLLVHAFIWWFWHLPILVGVGLKTQDVSSNTFINVSIILLVSIIPSMLHAVIFAYIWAETESLAVVTVYHAAFDEVRDTIESVVGFGPLVNIWQMVVIVIVGSLLLWKADWNKLLHVNEKYVALRSIKPKA